MSFFPFFSQFGPWNWLILAAVLFGLETMVPGVHFVWFGVAAVLAGIVALLTGIAWQWQLVIFAILAIAAVFGARRLSRSDAVPSDMPDLNIRGAQYIGRIVVVEEPIRSGRGKVRVGDTVWQAEGEDAAAGTRVKVIGARDTVLLISSE
jgi:membrane protein implicated in regulation of membrane protease activity